MAAQKRQCMNCRFFQDAAMAGNGWCTHPKRQVDSSLRLMVRSRELACRNSWGGDLFSSKDGEDDARPDPAASHSTDVDRHHPAPLEDEVTSVVTPPSRRLPRDSESDDLDEPNGEDRVVSDRPAPKPANQRDDDDDGRNDAARHDQDERARFMARGSGDALAKARERHLDRKRLGTTKQATQGSGDNATTADDAAITTRTPASTSSNDDQGITHQPRNSHRFSRREARKLTGQTSREQPVPRSEIREHQGDSATPGRYESVPEVDPSFDLPGWRRQRPDPEPDLSHHDEPVQDATTPNVSSVVHEEHAEEPLPTTYEHVLNRARRIREAKKPLRPHTVRMESRHNGFQVDTSPEVIVEPADDSSLAEPLDPPRRDDIELNEPLNADGASGHVDIDDRQQDQYVDSESVIVETPRERRRGWLAQFGISRRRHEDDSQLARRHDAEDEAEEWLEADLPYHQSDVDSQTPAGTQDDQHHEFGEDTEYADHLEPIEHDVINADYGDSETHYYANQMDEWDEPESISPAHGHADRSQPRYELPDLDALFSAPPVYAATSVHEHSELAPANTEGHDLGADGMDEESRVPPRTSRWARESSSSPSESFFRARRFGEWDREHLPRDERSEYIHRAGDPGDVDEISLVDHDDARSLPDLDANSFDLRDVVEGAGELLDMQIEVAPDVPRACRTCRSFRSADGGARGWCTNEWAFTHRRMVNEDDLACDATIGCLWLPADRYWMIEDEPEWADATPRMDAFMARGVNSPDRKLVGE